MERKRAFIQIPILIAIIVSIVVASGIGYGAIEYHKASKIIKESEQLTKEEKYDEAIKKLEVAQNKFLGKTILKQKINTELERNKKLLEDKSEYTQGLEEFNKGNWEKAKELLSKVSENFPHYQDAKNKIEQAQAKITEKRVAEEVGKVKEEAKKEIEGIKRVAEEMQKEAEEERTKRIIAEIQLQRQREITQQEIATLQREYQRLAVQWGSADTRVRIENLLRIGNLLQDYYNNIRESRNLGQNWWTGDYQDEANFASYLAQHDIGILYWPEYETKYHSLTGSYSYLDAKEKLDKVIFLPYTAGVDCYYDSDYEKIRKILQFFKFHIHYEPDLNQIIRAPVETLGLKSGDCDDWATLAAAAFARAGINSAIMMVKSKDGTQAHAMVLVQSEEDLPLWYYSDLTQFGLPSGRWWIIEPQITLEEQSLHPEWFSQWDIVAAAWVKRIECSTYTSNVSNGTKEKNEEYVKQLDTKGETDLRQISSAFEMKYSDLGYYPDLPDSASPIPTGDHRLAPYLDLVPNTNGVNPYYWYDGGSNQKYCVYFQLESDKGKYFTCSYRGCAINTLPICPNF
jgi:hypothetical protein